MKQSGDKFYRINDEGNLEILRLKKIKNSDCYSMINDETKEKIKLSQKQLDEYTKLIPDGIIFFTICDMGLGSKDVVITLFRNKDLQEKNPEPYAVCRQNITDIFHLVESKNEKNIKYLGCSVSQDTNPIGANFQDAYRCNGIIESHAVSVYLDDDLDTILSYAPMSKFDAILKEIYSKAKDMFLGLEQSVKDLLVHNDFMYDFTRAFNVVRVNTIIDQVPDKNDVYILTDEQKYAIEESIKTSIDILIVMKYDYSIKLDNIKYSYLLISDKENNTYVVIFNRNGYINREYDKLDDKRDFIILKNITGK